MFLYKAKVISPSGVLVKSLGVAVLNSSGLAPISINAITKSFNSKKQYKISIY